MTTQGKFQNVKTIIKQSCDRFEATKKKIAPYPRCHSPRPVLPVLKQLPLASDTLYSPVNDEIHQ